MVKNKTINLNKTTAKGNVRHVQISEPTRKSDGNQHGGDRANNRPNNNNNRNNDNRNNNGRPNDARNNDNRNNEQ